MPGKFDEPVWRLLRKIPKGKAAAYRQVAAWLGKPGAAGAAGNACGRNKNAQFAQIHTGNNRSPEETSSKKDILQLGELLKAMEKEWRYSEGLYTDKE